MWAARIGIFLILLMQLPGCNRRRTFAERIATPELPEFSERVKNYTNLVDRLEKDLPALPDNATADQISAHKKSLAAAIRKARQDARPGNIFTSPTRPYFVNTVRSEIRGPSGKATKQTIVEDSPKSNKKTPPVPLAVNALYPEAAPLATVPPTLLLRLPVLPSMVEYRFVGTALVLRDTRANIIVDYMPGVLY